MHSRPHVHIMILILALALFFAAVFNWTIFSHFFNILSALESYKLGFAISIPIVLVAALNFVFTPFSIKYFVKPFFMLLILSSSLVSYSMFKYGVIFDKDMIRNLMETNQSEATSYLNTSIVLWFLFTGILPCLVLAWVKIEYHTRWYQGIFYRCASMLASALIIGGIAALYYQDYASIGRNNSSLNKEIVPAYHVYSTTKYIKERFFHHAQPFAKLGLDAVRTRSSDKPTLMFLVVGETARAANFSSNGYHKETNPFTASKEGVISFQQVRSCGTATAISIPCMFSNMGRAGFDSQKAKNSEGLLDVLQRGGVNILWKENDGGCKGVCDRVPTITINPKDFPGLCNGKTCYDEVMLENIEHEIKSMAGDKLIAFHLIGSHGPTYFQRYPDSQRQFTPDCPRSDIENCSPQELENTYDNTIRYTDKVIGNMIDTLSAYQDKYQTALLYISDHGESLGELGLYLHGAPYKLAPEVQTHVPMQLWLSQGFAKSHNIDLSCLRNNAAREAYSHDHFFSSMLGLWNIRSSVYDQQLDLFAGCRS